MAVDLLGLGVLGRRLGREELAALGALRGLGRGFLLGVLGLLGFGRAPDGRARVAVQRAPQALGIAAGVRRGRRSSPGERRRVRRGRGGEEQEGREGRRKRCWLTAS